MVNFGDPIITGSIVIGGLSIAVIGYMYSQGKSLGFLSGDVKSQSPFEFMDNFRGRVEDKAEDEGQLPDLQVSQLDNLISQAVAHGREVERAKGQDSNTMFKMVKLNLALTGAILLGLLFLIFG